MLSREPTGLRIVANPDRLPKKGGRPKNTCLILFETNLNVRENYTTAVKTSRLKNKLKVPHTDCLYQIHVHGILHMNK